MSQHLLAADLDQIQNYIFGTDRMRTIRGASALVSKLGKNIEEQAKREPGRSGECLRTQGGQYVFITTEPKQLADIIHAEAQQIGGGAIGATIAWLPYPGEKQFTQTMNGVFAQIRALKEANQRGGAVFQGLLGGGFVRHCDLCKQHPATPDPDNPGRVIWAPGNDPQETRHLCLPCWKRKQGVEYLDLDEELTTEIRAEQARRGKFTWPTDFKPKFPADLEQIWPPGQEGRLIGIVTADGDGIGRILDGIISPDLYKQFSLALEKVSFQAAARAVCAVGLDRKKRGWIDLLPIIYGGDDFTFILSADKALHFALALATAFQDLTAGDTAIQEVLKVGGGGKRILLSPAVLLRPSRVFLL